MPLDNTIIKLKAHHHPLRLMGCDFVLSAVHLSPQIAWDAIRAGVDEISRIENLISSWKLDSETTAINNAAGEHPVRVSDELLQLILRSNKVSDITGGAFDISGSLARFYYNFNKEENTMPSDEKISELCHLINYQNIEINESESTVYLKQKGMKIGFGGIGKGYAAHRAHKVMLEHGVTDGLINASGDLMAWGKPPKEDSWSINLVNPDSPSENAMNINIPYGSVVTSGESESYTIINGEKHSHIIDPRTGRSARGAKSVSVLSTNPELCDALATGISVLGVKPGLNLVNRLNGVECIITDHENHIHFSTNLKNNKFDSNQK